MKIRHVVFLLCFAVSAGLFADLVGQEAAYTVNNDRSSWLIEGGSGQAKVTELRNDPKIGQAYVVTIDYEVDILFHGSEKGNIGLLVPEQMFSQQFYQDLKQDKTIAMGVFTVEYQGTSNVSDADGNEYDQCTDARVYDIDPSLYPIGRPAVNVLWHKRENVTSVENIELNVSIHHSVPVLGAVQIDVSGDIHGMDFTLGLDYKKAS